MVELHRDLIRLRREDAVFSRQDRRAIEGAVIGPEAFVLRWCDDEGDDRLMLFNLGRDFDWHRSPSRSSRRRCGRQWR